MDSCDIIDNDAEVKSPIDITKYINTGWSQYCGSVKKTLPQVKKTLSDGTVIDRIDLNIRKGGEYNFNRILNSCLIGTTSNSDTNMKDEINHKCFVKKDESTNEESRDIDIKLANDTQSGPESQYGKLILDYANVSPDAIVNTSNSKNMFKRDSPMGRYLPIVWSSGFSVDALEGATLMSLGYVSKIRKHGKYILATGAGDPPYYTKSWSGVVRDSNKTCSPPSGLFFSNDNGKSFESKPMTTKYNTDKIMKSSKKFLQCNTGKSVPTRVSLSGNRNTGNACFINSMTGIINGKVYILTAESFKCYDNTCEKEHKMDNCAYSTRLILNNSNMTKSKFIWATTGENLFSPSLTCNNVANGVNNRSAFYTEYNINDDLSSSTSCNYFNTGCVRYHGTILLDAQINYTGTFIWILTGFITDDYQLIRISLFFMYNKNWNTYINKNDSEVQSKQIKLSNPIQITLNSPLTLINGNLDARLLFGLFKMEISNNGTLCTFLGHNDLIDVTETGGGYSVMIFEAYKNSDKWMLDTSLNTIVSGHTSGYSMNLPLLDGSILPKNLSIDRIKPPLCIENSILPYAIIRFINGENGADDKILVLIQHIEWTLGHNTANKLITNLYEVKTVKPSDNSYEIYDPSQNKIYQKELSIPISIENAENYIIDMDVKNQSIIISYAYKNNESPVEKLNDFLVKGTKDITEPSLTGCYKSDPANPNAGCEKAMCYDGNKLVYKKFQLRSNSNYLNQSIFRYAPKNNLEQTYIPKALNLHLTKYIGDNLSDSRIDTPVVEPTELTTYKQKPIFYIGAIASFNYGGSWNYIGIDGSIDLELKEKDNWRYGIANNIFRCGYNGDKGNPLLTMNNAWATYINSGTVCLDKESNNFNGILGVIAPCSFNNNNFVTYLSSFGTGKWFSDMLGKNMIENALFINKDGKIEIFKKDFFERDKDSKFNNWKITNNKAHTKRIWPGINAINEKWSTIGYETIGDNVQNYKTDYKILTTERNAKFAIINLPSPVTQEYGMYGIPKDNIIKYYVAPFSSSFLLEYNNGVFTLYSNYLHSQAMKNNFCALSTNGQHCINMWDNYCNKIQNLDFKPKGGNMSYTFWKNNSATISSKDSIWPDYSCYCIMEDDVFNAAYNQTEKDLINKTATIDTIKNQAVCINGNCRLVTEDSPNFANEPHAKKGNMHCDMDQNVCISMLSNNGLITSNSVNLSCGSSGEGLAVTCETGGTAKCDELQVCINHSCRMKCNDQTICDTQYNDIQKLNPNKYAPKTYCETYDSNISQKVCIPKGEKKKDSDSDSVMSQNTLIIIVSIISFIILVIVLYYIYKTTGGKKRKKKH